MRLRVNGPVFLDCLLAHLTEARGRAAFDIWMPLMNGLEVQSQLHELSPSTRVIIFTRKRQPADSFQDIEGRGDSFLHQTFRRRGISHHRSPRAFWNMIWDIMVAPKHRRLR
jgi:Response regulator receiver domain